MSAATQTYDESMTLPQLRQDLVFSKQIYRGQTSFVVKDPVSLRYTRLGEQEVHFAGMLDGKRTFKAAVAALQKRFAHAGVDDERVSYLLNLFARMSWIHLPAVTSEQMFFQALEKKEAAKTGLSYVFKALMLPFYFKQTLIDPDRILIKLERRIRFMWTKQALVLLAIALVCAIALVINHSDRLVGGAQDFFTIHNLVSLWMTMIAVKIVHEFGHGLTCKHFGGEVHEMGAMFVVFTPFLFCDATDSWMFPNKWRKIAVNLAGIYFELWLAVLASFVWVSTRPGLVNELAINVMLICSVTTIFFNVNPLMRFDGYYVLSDYLETPNLRDRARGYVLQLVSHFTVSERSPIEDYGWRPGLVFFAIASYFYTWVVLYRIIGVIGIHLEPYGLAGAGQALEIVIFGAGLFIPLFAFGKRVVAAVKTGDPFVRQRLLRIGIGAAVALGLIAICPWNLNVVTGCVLGEDSAEGVHAKAPGFIREILVKEGQRVQRDQVVARIENRELENHLEDSKLRLDAVKLGRGAAMAAEDASALQQIDIQERQIQSLNEALAKEVEFLNVTAGTDGVVITPKLDAYRGLHVGEGDTICRIIPAQKVKIAIAIQQSDAGLVRPGQMVDLRFYSFPDKRFRGHVVKVFSSASQDLAHEALSARAGGEVPTQADASGGQHSTAPLYQAELAVDNTDGILRMGMTGLAKISCDRTFAGKAFILWFRRMLHLDFQV